MRRHIHVIPQSHNELRNRDFVGLADGRKLGLDSIGKGGACRKSHSWTRHFVGLLLRCVRAPPEDERNTVKGIVSENQSNRVVREFVPKREGKKVGVMEVAQERGGKREIEAKKSGNGRGVDGATRADSDRIACGVI